VTKCERLFRKRRMCHNVPCLRLYALPLACVVAVSSHLGSLESCGDPCDRFCLFLGVGGDR